MSEIYAIILHKVNYIFLKVKKEKNKTNKSNQKPHTLKRKKKKQNKTKPTKILQYFKGGGGLMQFCIVFWEKIKLFLLMKIM